MANVKHIFSGYGNPNEQEIPVAGSAHHYLDEDNGDLWLSRGGEWVLIYQGGSQGNIAFYGPSDSLPDEPLHPAIRFNWDGSAEIWDRLQWRQFVVPNPQDH